MSTKGLELLLTQIRQRQMRTKGGGKTHRKRGILGLRASGLSYGFHILSSIHPLLHTPPPVFTLHARELNTWNLLLLSYSHTSTSPQSSVKIQPLLRKRTWARIMKTLIHKSRKPSLSNS